MALQPTTHRQYGPRQMPGFRVLMRVLGYLVLADTGLVPGEELWDLLAEVRQGTAISVEVSLARLRDAGVEITIEKTARRTARPRHRNLTLRADDGRTYLLRETGVRLATVPPDELLEPMLSALDDLKLTGRVPGARFWAKEWRRDDGGEHETWTAIEETWGGSPGGADADGVYAAQARVG